MSLIVKNLILLSMVGLIIFNPNLVLAQKSNTQTNKTINANTTKQTNTAPGANANAPAPTTYDGKDEPLPAISSPVDATTFEGLITQVIKYLLSVIALAAIAVIIIAGLRMIVGSGNETQRKQSKTAITWAIFGLILALLSFSIVTIVQRILEP